jgi:hypothetical protein
MMMRRESRHLHCTASDILHWVLSNIVGKTLCISTCLARIRFPIRRLPVIVAEDILPRNSLGCKITSMLSAWVKT